jgi:hypothetical protein
LRSELRQLPTQCATNAYSVLHTHCTVSSFSEYSHILDRVRCIGVSASNACFRSLSILQIFSDFQYRIKTNLRWPNNNRLGAVSGPVCAAGLHLASLLCRLIRVSRIILCPVAIGMPYDTSDLYLCFSTAGPRKSVYRHEQSLPQAS